MIASPGNPKESYDVKMNRHLNLDEIRMKTPSVLKYRESKNLKISLALNKQCQHYRK